MVAISNDKVSVDSREIRSPERPIRTINRNAVYACFAMGIACIGVIFSFLLSTSSSTSLPEKDQVASFLPATEKLPILERLPASYDEIAEKDAQQEANELAEAEKPKNERQPFVPPPGFEYGNGPPPPRPQMGEQMPVYFGERLQKEVAEREQAEKSNVMFAASGGNLERSSDDSINNQGESSHPSQGMFFNQKSSKELTSKEKFLQNSGPGGPRHLQAAPSKFAVMQGTIVSAVLLTAINSDLPGSILAQVTTNVFDSKTGKYLLIPQGTKIVGEYNSSVSYGQQRAQVAWTRLILPNTESVDLGRMPGVDAAGASGVEGSVNRHYDQLAVGVLVTSLLSASVGMTQGPTSPNGATPQQIIGQSVGQEVSRLGSKMADKALDVQPTLKVPSGTKINVFATEDVLLKPYVYR